MDKYLKNLKLPADGIIPGPSGVVDINTEIIKKVIEEVVELSFNSIYAHLMLKFHEAGVYEANNIPIDESIIERIKAYFYIKKNTTSPQYGSDQWRDKCRVEKIWINKLFITELRMYTPLIFELNRQYLEQLYYDIISENQYNWLYVDTDAIYLSGSINSLDIVNKIGIPYEVIHHECFYIETLKKYIVGDINNLKIKGFRSYYPADVIAIMKQKIRDKKIDTLLS